MVIHRMGRLLLLVVGLSVVGGCSYFTPMAETQAPDGRQIKAPASTIEKLEYNWSREKQLTTLERIAENLLAPPDSPGNVSAQGEAGHNWKQAMVARDMKDIMNADSTNPYDESIAKSNNRWAFATAATYVLAPSVLAELGIGAPGWARHGGTKIEQNNRVEGSSISAGGDLRGGGGAPGGEAPGGDGAPAEGGSRTISIGGIGNMSNSQDAFNAFQSRFDRILHGQGTIGKQPQAGFGNGNQFAPIDDGDEGSAKLF